MKVSIDLRLKKDLDGNFRKDCFSLVFQGNVKQQLLDRYLDQAFDSKTFFSQSHEFMKKAESVGLILGRCLISKAVND